MIERKTEVKSFKVEAICDCGAIMVFSGVALATYPPAYPHKCSSCGMVENLKYAYPTVRHEEVFR